MNKITTLVLDVDGVINGNLEGTNTPFPSKPVLHTLQKFVASGGNLIFCTSKGIYPIKEMVEKHSLGGVHIVDAGGIIWNATTNESIFNSLSEENSREIIRTLVKTGGYFEVYTQNDWCILDKFAVKYTNIHTNLLRQEPRRLKSFDDFNEYNNVSKFMYYSESSPDTKFNTELFNKFSDHAVKWTMSPVLKPANLLVITKKGVSKLSALEQVVAQYGTNLVDALGVGDHHSDWKFMSKCGYQGVMGNSTEELLELAKGVNQDNVAYGGHVDEDGILDIFEKFDI